MNTYNGRRRLLGLAIVAVVFGAGTQIRPADAGASSVREVGKTFSPKEVGIAVNDKVVWTNQSNETHTVTFDNGPDLHGTCNPGALLRVGCQGPGATVERTFTAPGTYSYYCKFHGGPGGAGMAGVVVVSAVTTSSTPLVSTTTTPKASTTTTAKPTTSSTTTTTRALATSSTVTTLPTTTTSEATSVLQPGEPPPFSDDTSSAANRSGGSEGGSDSGTVGLIVGLLLAVSAGGGFLLWRLRPGRA